MTDYEIQFNNDLLALNEPERLLLRSKASQLARDFLDKAGKNAETQLLKDG